MATLEKKYAGKAFKILAFPCNEFGNQEPKSNEEIVAFAATKNFTLGGVGHMFAKTNVNAPCTNTPSVSCTPNSTVCCSTNSPVWTYLKSVESIPHNGKIPWNFEKYLCGKDGVPILRGDASVDPSSYEDQIDKLLAANEDDGEL